MLVDKYINNIVRVTAGNPPYRPNMSESPIAVKLIEQLSSSLHRRARFGGCFVVSEFRRASLAVVA